MDPIEFIKAIGGLQKLATVICIFIFAFKYKKTISSFLNRIVKLNAKKGNSGIELECNEASTKGDINELKSSISNQLTEKPDVSEIDNSKTEQGAKGEIKERDSEDDYFKEMFLAYSDRSADKLNEIYEKSKKDEKIDKSEKIRNKGIFYSLMFRLGKNDYLDKLIGMSKEQKSENPAIYSSIVRMVGSCYEDVNQLEEACELYIAAASENMDENDKAGFLCSYANIIHKIDRKKDAYEVMYNAIKEYTNSEALYKLYKELADMYKKDNNIFMYTLTMEKALEIKPKETDDYFNIALSYSNIKYYKLSLLHYKNLLKINPKNNGALNNSGVVYKELSLNSKSIEYYKKAFMEGSTISAANIAYEYIDNGFIKEAEKMLNEAREKDNVHPNVDKATSYIHDNREKEKEKEKEIMEAAEKYQRFLRNYGECYFRKNNEVSFDGLWEAEDGKQLTIKSYDSVIEGNWKDNRLEGEIVNNAIKTNIYTKSYNFAKSDYEWKEDSQAYLYMQLEEEWLNLLHIKDNKFNLYRFKKAIKE